MVLITVCSSCREERISKKASRQNKVLKSRCLNVVFDQVIIISVFPIIAVSIKRIGKIISMNNAISMRVLLSGENKLKNSIE